MYDDWGSDREERKENKRQKDKMMRKNKKDSSRIETKRKYNKRKKR